MVRTRESLIRAMQEVAPPHQQVLTPEIICELRSLTKALIDTCYNQATAEFARTKTIVTRSHELSPERLRQQLAGKRILVTGGTGCIGTALLVELSQFMPAKLASVSRHSNTMPYGRVKGVDYWQADISDSLNLGKVFEEVRPHIVYHLAAQRDPARAEVEVAQTIATNVIGTQNVLYWTSRYDAQVVYASTGKTVRPFTPDVYAATKKVGEWLMAEAMGDEIVRSGVRFTHVIDNSIILQRLSHWIASDTPIRLHGSEISFYMQSAKESAQLLLNAGLDADARQFTLQAIRDLDWPADLVDLATGAVIGSGRLVPLYFVGFESGYEEQPYPVLYDPMLSGDVSPLINALEAPDVNPSVTCEAFDRFAFEVNNPQPVRDELVRLMQLIEDEVSHEHLRNVLHDVGWEALRSRLSCLPSERITRMTKRYDKWAGCQASTALNTEHEQITALLRD